MGRLEVSRASAGTGKTYSICEAIVDRVCKGLDPARILATTFTVKAAAELKGRIHARLLKESSLEIAERIERVQRLELACLGTVDSVAKQLLERFALELGISPEVRVIEEESSERYLRRLLRELPAAEWSEFLERAEQLSLIDKRHRTRDASRVLLSLLRVRSENAIDDAAFVNDMRRSADELCGMLAPDGPDASLPGFERLRDLIRDALASLPVEGDTTKRSTPDAMHKLREHLYDSAAPWATFVSASRIKAGKTSNAILDPVREYASTVRRQPKLHDDLRRFLTLATELTVSLAKRYEQFKLERGVYDFTDLEVEVDRLLRDPALAPRVAAEFDFVVVDEFQDTSPLQLAIFTRLRELIADSYWVGDEKQAIYGFRGADARLMRKVWDAAEADAESEASSAETRTSTHSLKRNYRSRAGLVDFVNKTFQSVLGETVVVEADRTPTEDDPDPGTVERWGFETKERRRVEPRYVATGVRQWIDEGTSPGTIAVLARTKKHVYAIADALAERGVPTVVQRPGLLSERECRVAVAGLQVVADTGDGLAAATVLHLTESPTEAASPPTPSWFRERLEQMATSDSSWPMAFEGNATLAPLRAVAEHHRTSSPSECLIAVIAGLALPTRVARWGAPVIRSSHLDALIAHSRTYEAECAMAAHPATIPGLVAHFEELALDNEDYLPSLGGVDAVTVGTFHSAKGLEWDHVVLAELDDDHETDLWGPVAEGETNPRDPLEGRRLIYWPWPFGRAFGRKVRRGSEFEVDALASERGQRVETEQHAESSRLLYVGITRARERCAIVARLGRAAPWLERVPDVERVFPASGDEGQVALDGIAVTARRRKLEPGAELTAPPAATRWLDATPRPEELRATVDAFHNPSAVESGDEHAGVEFEITVFPGEPLDFERFDAAVADRLGNAVHQYLGALPSLVEASNPRVESAARHALDTWGFETTDATTVVEAGRRFQAWVDKQYPEARWLTELPVTCPRGESIGDGQWNGIVDLLLVQPDNSVVIVDHKSGLVTESGWATYASKYVGQLEAYGAMLQRAGHQVTDRWLHLPLGGGVVRMGP